MARRPMRTAKDLVDEVKAAAAEAVAREFERAAREWALHEVGPVLEDLRSRASEAGPLGEAWAKRLDRLLRRLRRGR